ncbi:MAG: beta-lactamase family protein [Alphaproteobacteria bacterium]|nr:beta-lactamase family protein [Alphaproteobacteria bacterium]
MQQRTRDQDGTADLSNWRTAPFSRWAFHHVRELVPTAAIAAGQSPVYPFSPAEQDLAAIAFAGPAGAETTVGRFLPDSFTDALLVLKGQQVLWEWYDPGYRPDFPHIVFSVSKSITACLAGVLVEQGRLDPDAPAVRYIPEAAGSAWGDCTVRHILDMTVDIAFEESYLDPDGDFARYREATGWNPVCDPANPPDLKSFLVTLPRAGKPHGEAFRYISPNSDFLGWLLERVGGKPFAELLSEHIWAPLGARGPACITVDRLGAPRTAGGICATARDLALFGAMMRDGGAAGGQQIVPRRWVDDIRGGGDREAWLRGDPVFVDLLPDGRYRSKWYQVGNRSGAFCAIGIHGQWLYIDPAADVVIAKLSAQPVPLDDPLDKAHLRAFDAICRTLA